MKVLFMGTPDFAKKSLESIYNNNYDIIGVVTNPDKPKGRGMKMIASDVKEYAVSKGLDIYQPINIRKNEEFINKIKELNPDIICVVAYGKILPKEVLDIPKYGCINVHASLLPKYRGAAPIQWAVINGEKTTGVTTMYMDVGMDTGDMILKEEVDIGEDETTGELWDRLADIGGDLLVKTLKKIENGDIKRTKQGDDYTLAPMLQKEMAKINWENKDAFEIKNLVRGLNPIMGAYSMLKGKKIKFWKVKVLKVENEEIKSKKNGEVILSDCKKGLQIKAKNGVINVLQIQGENAKRMPVVDFLRGNKIEVGEKFE